MIPFDFSPKSPKRISPNERKLLLSNNLNWCPRCKSVLPCDKFHRGQSYCAPCSNVVKQEYFDRHPGIKKEIMNRSVNKHREKRIEYSRRYCSEHAEKRREYSRMRTRLFPEYKRNYERNRRANDPLYRVKERISKHVRRVGVIGKNGRSLKFTGTKSLEEFCQKLALKCGDENWFKNKDYHIDHIWQIHWFSISEANWEEVCYLVNNHENLRPLKISDNLRRKDFDFSCLKREDFSKFSPFLKEDVRKMIEEHFNLCNS